MEINSCSANVQPGIFTNCISTYTVCHSIFNFKSWYEKCTLEVTVKKRGKTPFFVSHLSALRDGDGDLGPVVGAGGDVLDLPHDEEAVDDAAEHDVLLVQEVALGARDEELEERTLF